MLVTPSDGPGVLGGITRGQVLDLACQRWALSCARADRPGDALARAREGEVFLTSSIREIASVVRVDGRHDRQRSTPGDVDARERSIARYRTARGRGRPGAPGSDGLARAARRPGRAYFDAAMASISTFTPRGRAATWTVARAGGTAPK